MKALVRPLLSGLLMVLTVLGLFNVYGDNAEVVRLAEHTACDSCSLHTISVGRSPIAQTFAFQVDQTSKVVTVECQRSLYLVGEYSCVVTAP